MPGETEPLEGVTDALTAKTTDGRPNRSAASVGLRAGARVHQYELIRELGRGGMGHVFLARDTRLGRRVAIKFLLHQDRDRALAERFLVEARATARCNHENIVVIHEVNEHQNIPYMVLEYLEGTTLSSIIRERALPVARVVEMMLPVARALCRAHSDGIVHRDLKPDNIFLTATGGTKVLDFGIAKLYADEEVASHASTSHSPEGSLMTTRVGSIMGTPPYMSPEHWGVAVVDHRSDLWAVGIMMYQMVAGRHPLDPVSSEQLCRVATDLDTPVPSIRSRVGGVPERFSQLLEHCLVKRKAERLSSARELETELEALLPSRAGRVLGEGESPYPGLTSFQEADADRFFGRGADISRALARLREVALLAVVGPSGTGKSSFVRAGIIPALRRGELWDTYIVRPGRAPLSALTTVLLGLGSSGHGKALMDKAAAHRELEQRLRSEPGTLGSLLREQAHRTGSRVLLFVDQLEELYTLVEDPAERLAFTSCLLGFVDDASSPLRLCVSMRSDFLDRVAEDPRFTDEITRGLQFLRPLDRAALKEAVTHPLEMLGYRFEDRGLVSEMVDALEHAPGALPLLQFAASKLWQLRDREKRQITGESYQAIGGVAGALSSHADEVLASLPPADVKLVRSILLRLVTPERTRAVVAVEELHALSVKGEVERVLNHLVEARLLVVQTRGALEGASVEIVHESLIDRWPSLRRWLDEGQEDAVFRDQLREAARQWEARTRPQGLLWRGEAFEEARRWARRTGERGHLPAREGEYLQAVLDLGTRTERLKRGLVAGGFIFLTVLVAAAAIALMQIRQGKKAAQDEAARARAAEHKVTEQLDLIRTGEQAKHAAEMKAQEANAEVAMSQEELKAANEKLRGALRVSEAAAQKEKQLAGDLQKKKAELERLVATERERANRAEAERKRISRELR